MAEIRAQYTAIAEAAETAATPQIRNLATVAGNLLQRPRYWYFRHPDVDCLKKGGLKCYAAVGLNRYHAILGGGSSYIVHPSNLAPALIAFGAKASVLGPKSEYEIDLGQFFVLPQTDVLRENILQPGEIIAQIIVPVPRPNTSSVYLEAREKQSFDWPLVSVAVVAEIDGIEYMQVDLPRTYWIVQNFQIVSIRPDATPEIMRPLGSSDLEALPSIMCPSGKCSKLPIP